MYRLGRQHLKRFVFCAFMIGFCFETIGGKAQAIVSYSDSIKLYNMQRILLDQKGFLVLEGWGVTNILWGWYGYNRPQLDESFQYFHEGNVIWGVANVGMAVGEMFRLRKQAYAKPSIKQSYKHYLEDKGFYLISAGVDIAAVGTGLYLLSQSNNKPKNNSSPGLYNLNLNIDQKTAINRGFGESLCFQGLMRLLLDNFMYRAHIHNNYKWYDIIYDIQFMGNGIGFNYHFR